MLLLLPPPGLSSPTRNLEWPSAEILPRSILVMGDSTGFELDRYFPRDVYPAMVVGGTHYIGCALSALPYRLSTGDKDVKECQEWPARTSEYQKQWTPGAAVISSVVWDTFDRVIEGKDYPPGTPEFDTDFTTQLPAAIRVADRDGQIPVYVLKAECVAAQFEQQVLNDRDRRDRVNRLVDNVVASMPNTYAVDTSWLTCRGGRPAEEVGDSWVRRDGVHWSREGMRSLWQFILSDVANRK